MRSTWWNKALSAGLGVAMAFGGGVALAEEGLGAQASDTSWGRIWGQDRYNTMANIIGDGFGISKTVVVASGESFPDALAASSLAGAFQCPIVLTEGGGLSEAASVAIQNLVQADVAYVVGGTGTLGAGVISDLEGMGLEVTRVAGDDRQETSLAVAKEVLKAGGGSKTVIVAAGATFPDALSIGPYAWKNTAPILLTDNGVLSAEQIAWATGKSGATNVLIVGGEQSVSGEVTSQLQGLSSERVAGANRYETSAAICDWELTHGLTLEAPCIASGQNFPDALAGAPFAGSMGSVLLIADYMTDATIGYLQAHASGIESGYVLGGVTDLWWRNPLQPIPTFTGGIEKAIGFMRTACEDWSVGYDQTNRWDVRDGGEADCSALVYTALIESGILPADEFYGRFWLSTSTMHDDLTSHGWYAVRSDISIAKPGDILLNEGDHVVMVVEGEGEDAYVAQASYDENEAGWYGRSGDQNQSRGKFGETNIVKVRGLESGWDYILRYGDPTTDPDALKNQKDDKKDDDDKKDEDDKKDDADKTDDADRTDESGRRESADEA